MYDNSMIKNILLIILVYIFIHNNSFSNVNRDRIINYLEDFNSLKAEFIQINNDGDIVSGDFYIERPGKFRIEYNQIPLLILSDSKRLAVINKNLKSISFHSFNQIPVGILLFKKLSLNNIEIYDFLEDDNVVSVNIKNTKFENHGFVEIMFETKPFIMKKWTLFKNDRTKTEVFFNNLYFDNKLSPTLFDISREDPREIPFQVN
ncbi:MAG: LolA family protein [Alphaproteobacteria bacterium]|tara:strand:- start:128 stop:742 length:615 start_codon:yes stop_codon:yes gene_type:complete